MAKSDNPGHALHTALAAVELVNNDPDQARRLAEQALDEADGDPEARTVARRVLGMVATLRSTLAEAERYLRDAIAIADRARLSARSAEASGSLAYVLTLSGSTEEALALLQNAIPALSGISAARASMLRSLVLTEIGDFDAAEIAFAAAFSLLQAAGGNPLLEADLRNNRAVLRIHQRHWAAVDEDQTIAEALYLANGHRGRTALIFHNRGVAATTRGDLPTALAAYDEAERRYRDAGRTSGLLPVERAEALLAVLLVDEARAAAEGAVADFTRQGNAVDLVQARLVLARAALLSGDSGSARLQAERARRSALRQQRPGWAALAGRIALRARWEVGDFTASTLRTGLRNVAALSDAGRVVAAIDAQLIVAQMALGLGKAAMAGRLLAQVRAASNGGPAELRIRAWHAEAILRRAAGDPLGADVALRQGMSILDDFRASLGATELRAHAAGLAGELAGLGLRLAVESGRPEQILEWAEQWRAGALRLQPVRPPDAADLAQELAELRQLTARLASAVDTEQLLKRQLALEVSIRDRSRHAPGIVDQLPARWPGVPGLRAQLGAAVLVEFVQVDRVLHAAVLSTDALTVRQLGPIEPVDHALDGLRYGLRRLAYGIGSPASLTAAGELADRKAARLDELLLAPLADLLAGGPLVIVPTSGLHAMPWAVLPSAAGRPISVAPSAALWHRAASDDRPSDGRTVLVSGPGLPHAAAEVAALAGRYRAADRFTGATALVGPVIAALDGSELAHIAAHGHFRADNPLFSSLQLRDGPLTVHDLEGLRKAPRHVVLSACESGLPTVHPGDEVVGLAAALLSLGTVSLVATVAPVPDDTSRPLMLRYHRYHRAGRSPAAALAAAQHDLAGRGTASGRAAAAGFVCFGAG